MNHRTIVTGGAGLIGSNLIAALNAVGETDILVVDNLNHEGKRANLERISYAAYMDKAEFRSALMSGEIAPAREVYHLGACSSTTEMDEAYLEDNNVRYTRQLCEWSLRNDTRFVYASSAATYGEGENGYSDNHDCIPNLKPLNPYVYSKQKFDLWALEQGLLDRIVGIKYFNVFGPGEDHKGEMRSVVHKAYEQISATGKLELFRSHRPDYRDGEQLRDFVYVKDAARVTLFFGRNPQVNGIFNCGTGTARSWLDLGHAIFAAMDTEPEISFIDMPLHIRDKYQYYTKADTAKLQASGYATPFTRLELAVDDYVKTHLQR
jgi:ADP-L-glycero-D-manno-heptose 6-epimerase